MFGALARRLFGSANDRYVKSLEPYVAQINELEPALEQLSDEALRARTAEFKQRLEDGAELERQHGRLTETGADDAGVVQNGALVKIAGALIFANDDREIAAGIAVNRRSIHTFNIFNRERAAGSCLP